MVRCVDIHTLKEFEDFCTTYICSYRHLESTYHLHLHNLESLSTPFLETICISFGYIVYYYVSNTCNSESESAVTCYESLDKALSDVRVCTGSYGEIYYNGTIVIVLDSDSKYILAGGLYSRVKQCSVSGLADQFGKLCS